MVFYYKELFRPEHLEFIRPGMVDENFYLDFKKRLEKEAHFKFRSEINFWRTYWFVLTEFLICFFFACLMIVFYCIGTAGKNFFIFPFLFIVVSFKPSLYFIGRMRNYIRYVKEERLFHSEFLKAVQDSLGFEDFRKIFYPE